METMVIRVLWNLSTSGPVHKKQAMLNFYFILQTGKVLVIFLSLVVGNLIRKLIYNLQLFENDAVNLKYVPGMMTIRC